MKGRDNNVKRTYREREKERGRQIDIEREGE